MSAGANGAGAEAAPPPLGVRIRSARQARGLTQGDLGGRLGVTPTTVSRWERGQTVPDRDLRHALATVLGGTPADFLEGDVHRAVRRTRQLDAVADRIAQVLESLARPGREGNAVNGVMMDPEARR